MITEMNKQEIYAFLCKKLDFNTLYTLAEVGKELTAEGYGCRRYGFARMKSLMKELKEFIRMEDYEYEGHSNTNIIFVEWKKTELVGSAKVVWASTSAEMAEQENEMGAGLLNINRKKKNDQKKERETKEKTNKEKAVRPMQKTVSPAEKAKSLETESKMVYEKGKVGEFMRLAYLPPKIVDLLKRKGLRNPERVLASAYQHAIHHKLLQMDIQG